jgi:class 3 adenylate cyclase
VSPSVVLVIRTPNRQVIRLLLTEAIEIGRDCDGLIVADSLVSRRHARFEPGTDGVVLVQDLGSSNGTTIDGAPTVGATPATVGCVVELGGTRVEIAHMDSVIGTSTSTPTTEFIGRKGATEATSMERIVRSVAGDLSPLLAGAGIAGVTDAPDTMTLMFSDIEGSTARAVALGDAEWFNVLGTHNRLVTEQVRVHGGRIVKNQGDGFMVAFRSARASLLCAIGMQRALASWAETNPDDAVRVRIGMHTGEVMVDDGGDLFGKHVVTAARVGAAAEGGEILVSSLVKQIAAPRGDLRFGPPRELALKGLPDLEVVHRVEWS